MSWAKFDDKFSSHPKVIEAGPLAVTLHFHAIIYCAEYLTDGVIRPKALNRIVNWADDADDFGDAGPPDNRVLAKRLVHAGLWDEAPDGHGWTVHDYLDFNPSRADVEAARQKEADRKASWRAKRAKGPEPTPADVSRDCPAGTHTGQTDVSQRDTGVRPAGTPASVPAESQRPSRGDSVLPVPVPSRPFDREGDSADLSTSYPQGEAPTGRMSLSDLQTEGFERFGQLGGANVAKLARFAPVARWEWQAVLDTEAGSWAYAAKVLKSIRSESSLDPVKPASAQPTTRSRFVDVTNRAMEWAHAEDDKDRIRGGDDATPVVLPEHGD